MSAQWCAWVATTVREAKTRSRGGYLVDMLVERLLFLRREPTRRDSLGRVKLTIMIGLSVKFTPSMREGTQVSFPFFRSWGISTAPANY
ncbi:hypothetical protein C5Y93_17565 [Blastopirellula marina]|uniref:Uncharacterized protein n=1 Tax=Blastopirellula marina TaxID=124 RepID=A0A2S8GKD4_9BACT|nr:hypothetical protein C5Y93_17565 [Blastopirellula marina]